jgi:hypothetical protein
VSRHPEHPLIRAIALLAVSCVLALTVFAASPALHAGLHGHDHVAGTTADPVPAAGDDHACAVTLFAQGALALLVFCLLILARPTVAGLVLRATDAHAVAQPRYRHVPSHAPPAA